MKLRKFGGGKVKIYPENRDDSWKYEFSWSFTIFPVHKKAGIWVWLKNRQENDFLTPPDQFKYLDNHYKQM